MINMIAANQYGNFLKLPLIRERSGSCSAASDAGTAVFRTTIMSSCNNFSGREFLPASCTANFFSHRMLHLQCHHR